MTARPAIDGGVPAVTRPIPAWPVHDGRERELLLDVLRGTITGAKVEVVAAAFARFQCDAHAAGATTVRLPETLLPDDDALIDEVIAAFRARSRRHGGELLPG